MCAAMFLAWWLAEAPMFPPGTLRPSRAQWYSRSIAAMGEARATGLGEVLERYRFTWLRSFHPPVVVRIERTATEQRLIVKELKFPDDTWDGGAWVPDLSIDRSVSLTPLQWKVLVDKFEETHFWQMPTEREHDGTDGAEWILEGARPGGYHLVNRWSLEMRGEDAGFRAVCLGLLNASGIDPRPIY
jgi:hypothetical protein